VDHSDAATVSSWKSPNRKGWVSSRAGPTQVGTAHGGAASPRRGHLITTVADAEGRVEFAAGRSSCQ
jgi:hypothetical protein